MCKGPDKSEKAAIPEPKYIRIYDEVYDVTNFVSRHPGGKVILFYEGQDATDAFEAFHHHSASAKKWLKSIPKAPKDKVVAKPTEDKTKVYIRDDGEIPLVQDFRKLITKWEKEGYYDFAVGVLIYRMFEIFAMVGLSFFFFSLPVASPLKILLSSFTIGVAWTRCGWIQHDGGHCGLSGNSKFDHMIQVIFEGLVKGGSASWWRNRHNKHHAKCNVQGKDTDLNTYPFLSWDIRTAKKLPKKYIAIQHYTFIPLLGLYVPLFFFTTKLFLWRKGKTTEAVVSAIHYATFVYILSQVCGGTAGEIFAYFFCGYVVQGIYLGFCFALSHFAMPQIPEGEDDQDWVTNAISTTLNTNPTPFLSWLTGHLNLQVEHHLCPAMPTHNYLNIRHDVEELAKKHDIKYNMTTFWEASKFTIGTLKDVANQRRMIQEICESD
mmetsp:Transcript_8925/g.10210  ORF Transcript_8925/g.10210 Transcript_8925/m.10210 type:complete len:435 (+) Transcript_8925:187-1491(+)